MFLHPLWSCPEHHGRGTASVCRQARASDRSAGASIRTGSRHAVVSPAAVRTPWHRRDSPRRARGPSVRGASSVGLPGEPYLDPSSGALTAFTIDLVSRPAAAAAAAAIAERSRRCLGLMAVSRGGGVPDVYSGGSIGSTARRAQGGRARDASCTRMRPSSRRHRGDQVPYSLPFAGNRDGRHSGLIRTGSASTRSSGIAALTSSCCPAWLAATTLTTSWRLQPQACTRPAHAGRHAARAPSHRARPRQPGR